MQWVSYPEDRRYEVLACGHVRRVYDNGLPAQYCKPYDSRGYPSYFIDKRCVGLHRILCRTFHGPAPSPSHEVAHRNDLKGDYTLSNLYWATHKQNIADYMRNKKRPR